MGAAAIIAAEMTITRQYICKIPAIFWTCKRGAGDLVPAQKMRVAHHRRTRQRCPTSRRRIGVAFIAELPAGFAEFREIKGSDIARGGRQLRK
jgi:hypothetical protein